jgi:hypothetical protein
MNRLLRISLMSLGIITTLNLVAGVSCVRANLALHFSADDVLGNGGASTPSDGDPVNVWHDLVSGNNAQPGIINPTNPTNPPLYRNAPAGPLSGTSLTLNGIPTVQFGFNVNSGAPGYGTGLDVNFKGSKDVLPNMTVVWVGAGDVVNDYHPIWTFDGDTGGHQRGAAMSVGLSGLPGGIVIPPQTDPCCGPNSGLLLHNNDGLHIDAGGPQINVAAVDPLLGGDATWHTFAVTFAYPGKYTLTIDGHQIQSASNEGTPNPQVDNLLALGYFPLAYANGGHGNNLRMLLSDFKIYDTALSPDELNAVGEADAAHYGLPWTPIPTPEPATATLTVIGLASLLTLFGRRARKGG